MDRGARRERRRSTATSAARPAYDYVTPTASREQVEREARPRARRGCRPRLSRRRRCPIRSRRRCASNIRPSCTRASTCSRSPTGSPRRRRRVYRASRAVEVGAHEGCRSSRGRGVACSPRAWSSRRTTRSSTARSRSRALTHALLRDRLPHRRRPARGHAHQRRSPDALDPSDSDVAGEELLLVGGEGHKTGTESATPGCATSVWRLRARALGRAAVEHRWSAQDPTTPTCSVRRPADAAQRQRPDGDRLREVGA